MGIKKQAEYFSNRIQKRGLTCCAGLVGRRSLEILTRVVFPAAGASPDACKGAPVADGPGSDGEMMCGLFVFGRTRKMTEFKNKLVH
jgi:hypothetical protein